MFQKPVRKAPRPFPYDSNPLNRFGIARFTNFSDESEHVAIGRDGWVPFAYALALQQLDYRASGALARYMDIAGAYDGLGALEDWDTKDGEVKASWLSRFERDAALFDPFKLPMDDVGAMSAMRDMLFALRPPHGGVLLSCSREYADFQRLPQHKAYHDALLERYDWLQGHVAEAFKQAGFEVEGCLFKFEGFEALYHDDWDAFAF